MSRQFLGRAAALATWSKVFDTGEAVEVEEYGLPDLRRRRIYYPEVEAVTYYRYRMSGCLIAVGLLALIIAITALIVAAWQPVAGVIVFVIYAGPPILVFVVRLASGADVVTVHGRRTFARMKFYFMKDRAREVYEALAAKASAKQAEFAAAPPSPKAPPPELPPSPPATS